MSSCFFDWGEFFVKNRGQDFDEASMIGARFLQHLRYCSNDTIKTFRKEFSFPIATMSDLRFLDIENYVDATGFPLCFYFFNTLMPPVPTYTPYDGIIINHLNALPKNRLEKLKKAVMGCFNNPLISLSEPDPTNRITILLDRGQYGDALRPVIPEYKKISDDIYQHLYNYSYLHYQVFPADAYVDLATYTGVSLHWIFNFRKYPLFCNTVIADEIFSYYTLLEQDQWPFFMQMLLHASIGPNIPCDDLFRLYAYFTNADAATNDPNVYNAIRYNAHLTAEKCGLSEKTPKACSYFLRTIFETTVGIDVEKYEDLIGGAYLERFEYLALPQRRKQIRSKSKQSGDNAESTSPKRRGRPRSSQKRTTEETAGGPESD